MSKIYVLDTNVLLQDPYAVYSFEENDIVIPAAVLEEIDSKKRNLNEIGYHAREVSRIMDSLRGRGKLHEGVELETGGRIRVELNHRSFECLKKTFLELTNDNRIIAVALNLFEEEQNKLDGRDVILVSKDALVRVKADALGLPTEDFLSDRVINFEKIYQGYKTCYLEDDKLEHFYMDKELPIHLISEDDYYPNQFILMKGLMSNTSAVGIINTEVTKILPCVFGHDHVWGIKPRNVQQVMAFELLLRQDIELVTMIGKAGTGKTLLSLAAGLCQTEDMQKYKRMLIARPIVPVGKDLGFLPGEKEEKLKPWLQPIYDNLEYLFDVKKTGEIEQILAGISSIQVEALTYIRGRSIPEQFIIIDEAQNLTKHEVKTIITRVGDHSKIVLMGDPQQVDHPYLDEYNNGLTYVVEKMKNEKISGHVKLSKGERSQLAQIAADIL